RARRSSGAARAISTSARRPQAWPKWICRSSRSSTCRWTPPAPTPWRSRSTASIRSTSAYRCAPRRRWRPRRSSASRPRESEKAACADEALAQPLDVRIAPIAQQLHGIAAAPEREMHHPPISERDADVRDSTIVAVSEEENVPGDQLADVAARVPASLCLLPCVARELHAVQGERTLYEARTVSAPWCHAAPQIARAHEPLERGAGHGRRVARKTHRNRRRLDRLARLDDLARRKERAERQRARHTSGCSRDAAERHALPIERMRAVVHRTLRGGHKSLVHPAFVPVGAARAQPVALFIEHVDMVPRQLLRDHLRRNSRLAVHRRDRRAHDRLVEDWKLRVGDACLGAHRVGVGATGAGAGFGCLA